MPFSTATAVKVTTSQHAKNFVAACEKYGFRYNVTDRVVTVSKHFTAGDKLEFCDAESDAFCVLDHCPLKGGIVWGTDSGGIVGAVALKNGFFKLNKTVSGKTFTKAIAKLSK